MSRPTVSGMCLVAAWKMGIFGDTIDQRLAKYGRAYKKNFSML